MVAFDLHFIVLYVDIRISDFGLSDFVEVELL